MKMYVIFVIEDSAIIRDIVMFILSREINAHIVPFASAEQATLELDLYHPDLIILDHHLDIQSKSNMTGSMFLKQMKRLHYNIPTIAMSGQTKKNVTEDLLSNGAVYYICKNNEDFLNDLVGKVKNVLEK